MTAVAGRQAVDETAKQLTFGCSSLWKHNICLLRVYSKKSFTVGNWSPADSTCKGPGTAVSGQRQ